MFDEKAALEIIRAAVNEIEGHISAARAIPREQADARWVARSQGLGRSQDVARHAGAQITALLIEHASPLRSE